LNPTIDGLYYVDVFPLPKNHFQVNLWLVFWGVECLFFGDGGCGFKAVVFFKEKIVGGFNPSEKYAGQIGHLPQIGVKIKNL